MAQRKSGRKRIHKDEIKAHKRSQRLLIPNIGMMIFGVILIYLVYSVMNYLNSNPPRPYEVQEGSLSANSTYRGIVLREETVYYADTAGYLNYYAREGERVAKGDIVYTIDETGRFQEYLNSLSLGENTLSSKELLEFRNELVNFMHGFDPADFSGVYDFKYSLSGTVLRLANANMLSSLEGAEEYVGTFRTSFSQDTGIVTYWTDGYENLTPDQVTEDVLDEREYEKNQLMNTDLAAVGDPVYKLSTSEEWCVVIPVEYEEGLMLDEEGYIKVRFLKSQNESWASTELLINPDGKYYVKLGFNNSMVSFVSERFLDVELLLDEQTGLKIPNSAIAYRDFFLVPEAYITQSGNSGEDGVLRRIFLEDGTPSAEFVETNVYSYDEETGDYYLDADVLGMGDILIKPDSQETYTVSRMETLIGVYNMNKGYADFREINILAQNEEYSIVESNTRYGLNVYDNIV